MLTHNAPEYVKLAVSSVHSHTAGVDFELIVVDNASDGPTRRLVSRLFAKGFIDRLRLLDYNSLFAEGNNIASSLADDDATHFLLMNSDVKVVNSGWLSNLLGVHEHGITAYGVAEDPLRVDGYCLLIDADLYRQHPLDESHQWWWSVTKQQAKILSAGMSVKGYAEHEEWVHHFGGRSGSSFSSANGMNVTREEAADWFSGQVPVVVDGIGIDRGTVPPRKRVGVGARVARRLRRIGRRAASRIVDR